LNEPRSGTTAPETFAARAPLVALGSQKSNVPLQIGLQSRPGDLKMLVHRTASEFGDHITNGPILSLKSFEVGKDDVPQTHAPPTLIRKVAEVLTAFLDGSADAKARKDPCDQS
jgi:hypothetical protein